MKPVHHLKRCYRAVKRDGRWRRCSRKAVPDAFVPFCKQHQPKSKP
jgi:hypothetical protein